MSRPNILIFMSDQMVGDVVRPDHPCIMPCVDRFAEQGLRLEQTYCVAPHCSPSRASFFTGEYPSRHGIWNNVINRCAIGRHLSDGVGTWGEMLRRAGYELGFAGKWHISDLQNPEAYGWEEFGVTAGKGGWGASRIANYDQRAEQGGNDLEGPGILKRPGWGDSRLYGIRQPSAKWKLWSQSEAHRFCCKAGCTPTTPWINILIW